jgi:hypothetical protein
MQISSKESHAAVLGGDRAARPKRRTTGNHEPSSTRAASPSEPPCHAHLPRAITRAIPKDLQLPTRSFIPRSSSQRLPGEKEEGGVAWGGAHLPGRQWDQHLLAPVSSTHGQDGGVGGCSASRLQTTHISICTSSSPWSIGVKLTETASWGGDGHGEAWVGRSEGRR